MIKSSCILLILLFASLLGYGQQCFEYHKNACIPPISKYTYDETTNSVSFLFTAGQKRQVPLTLYAGKDYRIMVCGNSIFNDVILFKILKEDGQVIYDNSKFNYLLDIEFSSQNSQSAFIEIEVPDLAVTDSLKPKGCIGVLIEDMVSVKTGF